MDQRLLTLRLVLPLILMLVVLVLKQLQLISVKNNWVLAILALFMALLGAGMLFRKNRQV